MPAPTVSEIFEKGNNVYNLQNPSEFVLPEDHSIFHGIESISDLSQPQSMSLKGKLRNWNQKTTYVGYVNHTYKV